MPASNQDEGKHSPDSSLFQEPMPEESFGQCEGKIKKKRCKKTGLLANGLCESCWDRSITGNQGNKSLGHRTPEYNN